MLKVLVVAAGAAVASARTRQTFDFGWLFHLGDFPGWQPPCDTSGFNISLNGVQCFGLSEATATDANSCAEAACNSNQLIWQWCPAGATNCDSPAGCWIGSDCSDNSTNSGTAGWVSQARATVPPPAPVPPCTDSTQPCNPAFPDSDWRGLNVPHDFVVESPPNQDCDRGHGYRCYNVSWYRKHFDVDPSLQGQLVYLTFDGVYRSADVWLNGAYLGHHEEGYTSFHMWIHNASAPLKYGPGGNNVLSLRVNAIQSELWSYEPGGIYRHVWLNSAAPVSIVPWGFYGAAHYVSGNISSPQGGAGLQTADQVVLMPQVDVANAGSSSAAVSIAYTLADASGNVVASASASTTIAAGGWTRQTMTTTFGSTSSPASLWNTAVPYLYNATVTVSVGGAVVDAESVRVGLRSAVFDPRFGFLLNGLKTWLQGTSNHIDFGGCGGAVPDRVNEWRVANLRKDMGCNAFRTAHNPVAPEFLDAADEYGMLVWSENRFINTGVQPLAPKPIPGSKRGEEDWWKHYDTGRKDKRVGGPNNGPSADPQLLQDAQDMVLRDRNHPSIIIWSLCNEGGCEQGAAQGGDIGIQFKEALFSADTQRPVTGNSEWGPGSSDTFTSAMDVMSFSYAYGSYSQFKQYHPWKAVGGGESASCTSTRGYYLPNNATTGYVNADDFGCVQEAWQSAATLPYVYGNFAWTGYDYKGEPSPMNWPCINSHFGIYDIAGFRKDSVGYYRAWWAGACNEVHLSPGDWTQPVPTGTAIDVSAFTCAASVALYVNGVSQGSPQSVPQYGYVQWKGVTFTPGNLTAVAYDGSGNVVATQSVVTAGAPFRLRTWLESPYNPGKNGAIIAADGQDTTMVGVAVEDANGVTVPIGSFNITFTVSGPGAVYGVANGDPSDHSPDKGAWRFSFHGLARAFISSSAPGATGAITVTASTPGLQPSSVAVTAQ